MITILQMAAGAGTRFQGSNTPMLPKVQHKVDHRRMWEYVAHKQGIGTASRVGHIETGLVILESHYDAYLDRAHVDGGSPYHNRIIPIPEMHTQGPAWSVAAATLDMPENNQLILMDSDCYVAAHNELTPVEQVLATPLSPTTTVCMFAVRAKEITHHASQINQCAYFVTSVEENTVAKDHLLNVGIYYFRSIGHFRRMLRSIHRKAGEFKINDLINMEAGASQSDPRVEVKHMVGDFVNLGTPSLLEKYRAEKGYA